MQKQSLVLAALLLSVQGYAQITTKKMEFGFNFGANLSSGRVSVSDPEVKNVSIVNGTGFQLGLLAELPFSKHLSVKAVSELAFYSNNIQVVKTDKSQLKYDTPPVVEAATLFQYRFCIRSVRPYLLAGPAYKVILADKTDNTLHLSQSFAAMDFGFGIEKTIANVCIAPELRYSYGITDLGGIPASRENKLNSLALVVNIKGRR